MVYDIYESIIRHIVQEKILVVSPLESLELATSPSRFLLESNSVAPSVIVHVAGTSPNNMEVSVGKS